MSVSAVDDQIGLAYNAKKLAISWDVVEITGAHEQTWLQKLRTCIRSKKQNRSCLPASLKNDLARSSNELIRAVRKSIIGEGKVFEGPFGCRSLTYADYTASGRSVDFIEGYILHEVLPWYANTHSDVACTGKQTNIFREDARRIIHSAVNGSCDDVVIFLGSGTTAAINRIIDILGLRYMPFSKVERLTDLHGPEDMRPVVFIGPYEHHSNDLPWRESTAEVVRIRADANGLIDQDDLEKRLTQYNARKMKIGSFSAASNVTGIITDMDSITVLLNRYGALSFWDYAAAGPYVKIDMNPEINGGRKDAIFLSPHKFVGGPGTPGVLVIKKDLFQSQIPSAPGGGTVDFVTADSHKYVDNITTREEGGTPAIIESIRAGLVFKLKEQIGVKTIHRREQIFIQYILERWRSHPRIKVLGNGKVPRLAIVSFLIVNDAGLMLHHNFVVALLNDLFGIQARGGCSCAGPYGHDLLNISKAESAKLVLVLNRGFKGMKPGWVRMNFNYFMSTQTFEFLISAVEFIAEHGERFLLLYQFDIRSGIWSTKSSECYMPARLDDCTGLTRRTDRLKLHEALDKTKCFRTRVPSSRCFADATALIADKNLLTQHLPRTATLDGNLEALRWFLL